MFTLLWKSSGLPAYWGIRCTLHFSGRAYHALNIPGSPLCFSKQWNKTNLHLWIRPVPFLPARWCSRTQIRTAGTAAPSTSPHSESPFYPSALGHLDHCGRPIRVRPLQFRMTPHTSLDRASVYNTKSIIFHSIWRWSCLARCVFWK